MQLHDTNIADVKRVSIAMHEDARGFFCERFRADIWRSFGLPELRQLNHSRSKPGVLRGLHLQHSPAQGKLVGVLRGRIFDVAVDIRPHSPSYLQHVAMELTPESMLWMPKGFLHGFCVLPGEEADVLYYTTDYYSGPGEAGVRFDDPQIAIDWPIATPMLSERDSNLPYLADAKNLYNT
jgi:dTDP-4-dehydrorhamnose 3,5-epimerase